MSIVTQQEIFKAVLAGLLPDMTDDERWSSYAQECGLDGDDVVCDEEAIVSADVVPLSVLAGQGKVLPLLVWTSFELLKRRNAGFGCTFPKENGIEVPDVNSVVERAFDLMEKAEFKKNLRGVFCVSKRVPIGPARWFFAFAISQVVFADDERGDAFWRSKSKAMIRSLLMMSNHLSGRFLDAALYEAACNLKMSQLSTWERKGYAEFDQSLQRQTIFAMFVVIHKHVHWNFSSAHEEMMNYSK